MSIFIQTLSGSTGASIVRDGVKAAFGFTLKRVYTLAMVILAVQVVIAIAFIVFISPENFLALLNGLFTRLGLEPINCSTLPEQVCPLLNIAGFQEAYAKACKYAVSFLLLWWAVKRLMYAARHWFILRGFGS